MNRIAVQTCLLMCSGALLPAQLTVPHLGFARFPDGSIHKVQGMAANLIVDQQVIGGADHASFADSAGLTSSKGLIQLWRRDGTLAGEYQSDDPLAQLNIDSSPQSAAVWLPSKHSLLTWSGTSFVPTMVDDSAFGGRIVFVRLANPATAEFYVVVADSAVTRITVALPAGRLVSSDVQPGIHPSANGAVFVQQGWVISQTAKGLTADLPDGKQQAIALSGEEATAGDLTIERMSNDWLHVVSKATARSWAIYLTGNKVSVSQLPPPRMEANR